MGKLNAIPKQQIERRPRQLFLTQTVMLRVCAALLPPTAAAVYFFGWRALALMACTWIFGILTEALFTLRQGKPVTSAVLVTCLIYALSLPPATPFWMAALGIIFGVGIGKMAFGGFGHNVFNPAMVGRCFLYVSFPVQLTNTWMQPFRGGAGGFAHWFGAPDAVTRATPLIALRQGDHWPLAELFFGTTPGSLGETSALLILLGGAFLLYKKAAPWRLAAGCLLGGVLASGALHLAGAATVPAPLYAMTAGSFLFGAFFVVTEPISGAKTHPGQWIYGLLIGGVTIALRGFSNFSEGIMFSVLIMNAFVPLLDRTVRRLQPQGEVGGVKKRILSIVYMFLLTLVFTSMVSAVKVLSDARIQRNEEIKLQHVILRVLGYPLRADLSDRELADLFALRVRSIEADGRPLYVGYAADGRSIRGYAFPVGGPGFWGPVAGMAAVDARADALLGIAFYRHSETPGLGGRISEEWFARQFQGLPLVPIAKSEKFFTLRPEGTGTLPNELDAVTGATGTSRAVETFLNRDLERFLRETWKAVEKG